MQISTGANWCAWRYLAWETTFHQLITATFYHSTRVDWGDSLRERNSTCEWCFVFFLQQRIYGIFPTMEFDVTLRCLRGHAELSFQIHRPLIMAEKGFLCKASKQKTRDARSHCDLRRSDSKKCLSSKTLVAFQRSHCGSWKFKDFSFHVSRESSFAKSSTHIRTHKYTYESVKLFKHRTMWRTNKCFYHIVLYQIMYVATLKKCIYINIIFFPQKLPHHFHCTLLGFHIIMGRAENIPDDAYTEPSDAEAVDVIFFSN